MIKLKIVFSWKLMENQDTNNTEDILLSDNSVDNENCRLFKVENYMLTIGKNLELQIPPIGKVEELKNLHENLIKTSIGKISKMPPKIPRHQTKINRELSKIETCLTNAKQARDGKNNQEVHQYKCELQLYESYIQEYKEDLNKYKNEEEINDHDTLEDKLREINVRVKAEIANDEFYLVEKMERKFTHKLEKMKITKF